MKGVIVDAAARASATPKRRVAEAVAKMRWRCDEESNRQHDENRN
jgi:hypothetical protein